MLLPEIRRRATLAGLPLLALSAFFGSAAHAESAMLGTVVRSDGDVVVVAPNRADPTRVGAHVLFSRAAASDDAWYATDEGVVGEVEGMRGEVLLVRIGPNERVHAGAVAELTSRPRTSTAWLPAIPTHALRLELMGGPLVRERGGLGEANVTLHHGSAYFALTLPGSLYMPPGYGTSSSYGVQGTVSAGFQHRFGSIGGSLGLTHVREAGFDSAAGEREPAASLEPTIGIQSRLGSVDGASLTADLTLAAGASASTRIYRMVFGASLPVHPRLLVSAQGGRWFTGESYTDFHLAARCRLTRTGRDDAWYLKAALSFIWATRVENDGHDMPTDQAVGLQLGMERRFGTARRAPRASRPSEAPASPVTVPTERASR